MAEADARFGDADVRLPLLADRAGLLRREDRVRVTAAMERMQARFPQLFVAVHTGPCGGPAAIRQFGLWLLNHAAFEDLAADKPNEAGILLTLDPETRSAGIVFGYLLDPFLDDADTFACLSRAHAYWLEGRHAEGILKLLAHLEGILRKRSRQARRSPMRFLKPFLAPEPDPQLREIRSGHRQKEPQAETTRP
jgi:hypothetical protein